MSNISGRYYIVRFKFPPETKAIDHNADHKIEFGIDEEAMAFARLMAGLRCKEVVVWSIRYKTLTTVEKEWLWNYGASRDSLQYPPNVKEDHQ